MIYILTYTQHEFAVTDAINDMGALAMAPRRFAMIRDRKQNGKHVPGELPALPGYVFTAMTEAQWHIMHRGFMINGHRVTPRVVVQIDPREWATVRTYAERAEMDYQIALDQQGRPADSNFGFTQGDQIQLLSKTLRDTIAKFNRVIQHNGHPMIEADTQMFGQTVKIKVDPSQVVAWPIANSSALG